MTVDVGADGQDEFFQIAKHGSPHPARGTSRKKRSQILSRGARQNAFASFGAVRNLKENPIHGLTGSSTITK